MSSDLRLDVIGSAQIVKHTRDALRELWDQAFGGSFTDDDADHAFGGVHVLARDGGALIGHASVIPREIKFGDEAWRNIGYVEAVATASGRRGEGVGRVVMATIHSEIAARWPLAMLSTGRARTFYELLGWTRWVGDSFTETSTGTLKDQNHGGLMVLQLDGGSPPDARLRVTCRDRPGNAW